METLPCDICCRQYGSRGASNIGQPIGVCPRGPSPVRSVRVTHATKAAGQTHDSGKRDIRRLRPHPDHAGWGGRYVLINDCRCGSVSGGNHRYGIRNSQRVCKPKPIGGRKSSDNVFQCKARHRLPYRAHRGISPCGTPLLRTTILNPCLYARLPGQHTLPACRPCVMRGG